MINSIKITRSPILIGSISEWWTGIQLDMWPLQFCPIFFRCWIYKNTVWSPRSVVVDRLQSHTEAPADFLHKHLGALLWDWTSVARPQFIHSLRQLWISRPEPSARRLDCTVESEKTQAIMTAAIFWSCDKQAGNTRWVITFKHTTIISKSKLQACSFILCPERNLPTQPCHQSTSHF